MRLTMYISIIGDLIFGKLADLFIVLAIAHFFTF